MFLVHEKHSFSTQIIYELCIMDISINMYACIYNIHDERIFYPGKSLVPLLKQLQLLIGASGCKLKKGLT